jgi:hypothetical protein
MIRPRYTINMVHGKSHGPGQSKMMEPPMMRPRCNINMDHGKSHGPGQSKVHYQGPPMMIPRYITIIDQGMSHGPGQSKVHYHYGPRDVPWPWSVQGILPSDTQIIWAFSKLNCVLVSLYHIAVSW